MDEHEVGLPGRLGIEMSLFLQILLYMAVILLGIIGRAVLLWLDFGVQGRGDSPAYPAQPPKHPRHPLTKGYPYP